MALQRLTSHLVSWLPSALNSITRSLQSKLGDLISEKDFGVKGTGVDDSLAFSKWLAHVKLVGHGKLSGPVYLLSPVDFDFSLTTVTIEFGGNPIYSDADNLILRNLGAGSSLLNPNMVNITAPWVITRWSGENWISNGTDTLATLTQTNALGYYQPTVNDSDIWSSLPAYVQSQAIRSCMMVVDSSEVLIFGARGRHAVYDFRRCSYIKFMSPSISSGGRHQYGTVVFNNTSTSAWGYGNEVKGGYIGYGSVSSVTFMRNRKGGAGGGLTVFRSGESGVKTYQNNEGGRSARCYQMNFDGISAIQTVFDGVDFNSDYGDTGVERVDDYTIAQYAWHKLPTNHTVRAISSRGCRGVGVWFDGQGNTYESIKAEDCRKDGLYTLGENQIITSVQVVNCNKDNRTSGTHQINVPLKNTLSDLRVTVTTLSGVTQGANIYAILSDVTDFDVSNSILTSNTTLRRSGYVAGGYRYNSRSDSQYLEIMNGIGTTNPCGRWGAVLTLSTPGSEAGWAYLQGTQGGAFKKGFKAIGDFNGVGAVAVGNSNANTGSGLVAGEAMFYQDAGGELRIVHRKEDGTFVRYQLTTL